MQKSYNCVHLRPLFSSLEYCFLCPRKVLLNTAPRYARSVALLQRCISFSRQNLRTWKFVVLCQFAILCMSVGKRSKQTRQRWAASRLKSILVARIAKKGFHYAPSAHVHACHSNIKGAAAGDWKESPIYILLRLFFCSWHEYILQASVSKSRMANVRRRDVLCELQAKVFLAVVLCLGHCLLHIGFSSPVRMFFFCFFFCLFLRPALLEGPGERFHARN